MLSSVRSVPADVLLRSILGDGSAGTVRQEIGAVASSLGQGWVATDFKLDSSGFALPYSTLPLEC